MSIRVFVADDFPLLLEGVAAVIGTHPEIEIVGFACDGGEAVEGGSRLRPDVMLLDVRMPGVSGIDVIDSLRREAPETKVIVLTATDDPRVMLDALAAGAEGYLTQRSTPDEICDAILKVHAGSSVITPLLASHLLHEYAGGSNGESDGHRALSDRERDVVRLLSDGMTDREIAERLYLSIRTVQYSLASTRRKAGVERRSELAAWAVRHL